MRNATGVTGPLLAGLRVALPALHIVRVARVALVVTPNLLDSTCRGRNEGGLTIRIPTKRAGVSHELSKFVREKEEGDASGQTDAPLMNRTTREVT